MADGKTAASFGRGPERRSGHVFAAEPARRSQGERRVLNLQWIPLFEGVNEAAVMLAIGESPVLEFAAGTEVIELGQINDHVYILLHGTLEAHLATQKRDDQAIPIALGQCIGELSVIDGQPASASVVAKTEVRLLQLSTQVFWDRLMLVPGVARNLALTLSDRMRRTNARAMGVLREQLALEHLRRELDAARQLQISMLPLQRPMFPDRYDLEVSGLMEAAASVGGDFFDVFFLDDEHMFFCVGDVSGHGIASALFMARAIGLIRVLAMSIVEPDQLLAELNDRLCVGNDSNLFVTLFCAVLDVGTGQLLYSNGGHCAPIFLSGATAHLIAVPKGPLIGAFPKARYSCLESRLALGDVLFCYSDGITEACSEQGEEFGEDRCLEVLVAKAQSAVPFTLDHLLDEVRSAAARFTSRAEFEDDCTLLALRRVAAPATASAHEPVLPLT